MNSAKIAVIALLALALGLLLYLKPWENDEVPPRFLDRLPEATVIGRSNLLEISKMLVPVLHENKVAFRDFLSPEFILSQGKGYGLDVQSPVYFFANANEKNLKDWGLLVQVKDSSKVHDGIVRLQKFFPIVDTVIAGQHVFYHRQEKITLDYGKNWLLLCYDSKDHNYLRFVHNAKLNGILPRWRTFLNTDLYSEQPFVFQLINEKMNEQGIQSVLVAGRTDSLSMILNARVTALDTLPFTLKATGPALEAENYTKHLINTHFDVNRLRQNENDPVHKLLHSYGSKIGFPVTEFLQAWEGDIAFRQGGIQIMKERYIESEFDDDFNVTEVVKYKDVKISGFALQLSMNEKRDEFLNKLFAKGIMTRESDRVRILYSPPLYLKKGKDYISMNTSRHSMKLKSSEKNEIIWTTDYTPYYISIDSLDTKSVYGTVQFPLKRLLETHLPILKAQ